MEANFPGFALAPLDSARVVSTVYSLSLVTLGPFVGAAVAAVALRRMSAGARSIVWRASVVTLLVIAGAQLVPLRWEAWVLPAALADPLIALGRHAVRAGVVAGDASTVYPAESGSAASLVITLLCIVYLAGVSAVLSSGVRAIAASRRLVASARPLHDPAWLAIGDEVRGALGISRAVPLLASARIAVPIVAGVRRPVVLVPTGLLGMPAGARRAVLLHELAHVRAGDIAYALAAHVACALFWFHPGAWWVARRLRREAEMACDDCVLQNGTRQSEYARLLVSVADRLHLRRIATFDGRPHVGAPALTGHGLLRDRLAAIITPGLDRRTPRRGSIVLALCATIVVAGPLGLMKLEPTRTVLQALMEDRQWESRAYAVLGLAPRSDSLAVTQHAATADPSPRVRAWAAYALARHAAAHPNPAHRSNSPRN